MKSVVNVLKKILPHLNIIMVVVLVVLLIVDICNPFMEFINNNITKGFIWFVLVLAILNAIVMLWEDRAGKNNNGADKVKK